MELNRQHHALAAITHGKGNVLLDGRFGRPKAGRDKRKIYWPSKEPNRIKLQKCKLRVLSKDCEPIQLNLLRRKAVLRSSSSNIPYGRIISTSYQWKTRDISSLRPIGRSCGQRDSWRTGCEGGHTALHGWDHTHRNSSDQCYCVQDDGSGNRIRILRGLSYSCTAHILPTLHTIL